MKSLNTYGSLQLQVDTKGIHPNRLRQLSKIGSRYEPHSFRRFNDPKKYAILVAYLLELIQDLTDLAFEIHDRQIMILLSKGRKAQEELQKQNGKSINEKVVHFADLGAALIKARSKGIDPFVALDAVMPWDRIVASVEEAKRLARPLDYDYLDLLEKKFYALRKYTPTLLKSLEFRSTKSAEPLMKAVDIIRDMNETGKRKVPEGAPLNFVSNRWQKHVYDDDGTINRHYYEMAVLTELRNYVRSGDVSIVGSRQHKDFEEYLEPKSDCNGIDPNATKLAVSLSAKEYLEERTESLLQRLNWVSDHIDQLDGVNLENGKLHIERLEKDVPDESRSFSLSLYELLPRIKLTDLLMEVANWTNFHEQFIHASSNRAPNEEETKILMATLMAMGTNIGLTKMAEATPSISYRQMANTAQWRLYEDAMNKAQAVLVNFHHKLALPSYWGNGTTSSSDGMRVQIGVSALHADANPHYGTGKGATIYRFVSDQFSTFYAKVINTNARDAVHVIDGLLHHETDLAIEEHYTDTAGYTDQVFGLTHLLGFRFAPRLRDLVDSKLYAIGKSSDFPKLEKLLRGQINTKIIQENYDDVLRLAHSIREGTVSASLIMGKIGSYARQNSLATALREMGRIEKTILILDYLSSEALRRKIHRGLNKGEATIQEQLGLKAEDFFVLMEPTGGHYSFLIQQVLSDAGYSLYMVQISAVKRFREETLGINEKSDAIDARIMAYMGWHKTLHPDMKAVRLASPASMSQSMVRTLMRDRWLLTTKLTRRKNQVQQLFQVTHPDLKRAFKKLGSSSVLRLAQMYPTALDMKHLSEEEIRAVIIKCGAKTVAKKAAKALANALPHSISIQVSHIVDRQNWLIDKALRLEMNLKR